MARISARISAGTLVKELQRLDHGPRAERIGRLAASLPAGELGPLVQSLRAYGDFGAHVSIFLGNQSAATELVVSFLTHQSAFVRRHAGRVLHRVDVADQQLFDVFELTSTGNRRQSLC